MKTFVCALFTKIKFTVLKSVWKGRIFRYPICHLWRKFFFHLLEGTANTVLLKRLNMQETAQYFSKWFLENRSSIFTAFKKFYARRRNYEILSKSLVPNLQSSQSRLTVLKKTSHPPVRDWVEELLWIAVGLGPLLGPVLFNKSRWNDVRPVHRSSLFQSWQDQIISLTLSLWWVSTSKQQYCGSGMFIPDPNFFHPWSRIRIKEFRYFSPKHCS